MKPQTRNFLSAVAAFIILVSLFTFGIIMNSTGLLAMVMCLWTPVIFWLGMATARRFRRVRLVIDAEDDEVSDYQHDLSVGDLVQKAKSASVYK